MTRGSLVVGIVAGLLALGQGREAAPQPALSPGDNLPGNNLVIEQIPPIPADVVAQANRYAELRFATMLDWHPRRREMLIATRFADTAQIHLVKMPGGARTQLTFFADRAGGAQYGPPGSDYFVFSKDVGGGEWHQLYRYDLSSGAITLLTDGRSRNLGARFAHREHRFAYASTRRTSRDSDIWVMDARDPASDRRVLDVEGGGWRPLDWRPDGKEILVRQVLSVNETYLWLVDVASGQRRLLTPKTGDEVSYAEARFSRDGRGLYVITDRDAEFRRLAYVDLATLKPTFLTADVPWDVEDFELSADGKTVAFVANEDGIGKLYLYDTARRRHRPVPGLPAGLIGGLTFHKNSRDLGFTVNFGGSPSDVYSLDTRAGTIERWTHSEVGGLNPATFATARLIKWETFDGRMLSGFLYAPDPRKFPGKRPVMVNIHGGPEGQARPGFLGRGNYYVNELGVAIVFPNVRGSTGYGKTFVKLDNGTLREDTYKDIAALLGWIGRHRDLDGGRIVVIGGSYGGYLTWATAAFHGDKICCAVSVAGPTSLVTMLEGTEAYRRDLRRAEYGDERDPTMREYLERIAPLHNADRVRKPIFAVVGKNDPRVPWTESRQMLDRLKESGVPAWFLMANDEGHGFVKKKNQDFQFYATVMFVRRFLLGEDAGR
jgi:dipeptidyl aminopeptidase/acylaminoacyl peptidase